MWIGCEPFKFSKATLKNHELAIKPQLVDELSAYFARSGNRGSVGR
jgi:hypothetical protein